MPNWRTTYAKLAYDNNSYNKLNNGLTDVNPTLSLNEHAKKSIQQVSDNRQTPTNDKRAARVFAPPTPSMVEDYASEAGLTIDAAAFCDYYTSNGWKVGRNPMKDWKAAARMWAKREGEMVQQVSAPAPKPRKKDSAYAKMMGMLEANAAEIAEMEGRL